MANGHEPGSERGEEEVSPVAGEAGGGVQVGDGSGHLIITNQFFLARKFRYNIVSLNV